MKIELQFTVTSEPLRAKFAEDLEQLDYVTRNLRLLIDWPIDILPEVGDGIDISSFIDYVILGVNEIPECYNLVFTMVHKCYCVVNSKKVFVNDERYGVVICLGCSISW